MSSTDFLCQNCCATLAKNDGSGIPIVNGIRVVTLVGACPKCGYVFAIPSEHGGLEINAHGIERLFHSIKVLEANDGNGVIIAEFRNHKLLRAGLDKLTWNIDTGDKSKK